MPVTKRLSNHKSRSNGSNTYGLTPENARALRALNTPAKIQKFIDDIPYQYSDTAWSPSGDTLAFMFESRYVIHPTSYALAAPQLQRDYPACWRGLVRHFDGGR